MCWLTSKITKCENVAIEDINVFKVVNADNKCGLVGESMYFKHLYKVGETYTSDVIIIEDPHTDILRIEVGLHSHSSDKVTIRLNGHCAEIVFKSIIFIDCFSNMERGGVCPSVMLCTIPKGSTYYENEIGEIVSDAIRIDKIVSFQEYVKNK